MLAVSAILLSASVNLPVKAEAKSSLEEAFRTGITSELTEEESSIYNEYTALQEKYLSLPRTKPVLLDKGATTKEYGAYPTRTGVILITTGGEAGSYVGHAGIVT